MKTENNIFSKKNKFRDSFNWPIPKRGDSMYLSTLRENNSISKEIRKERNSNLDVRDINSKKKPIIIQKKSIKDKKNKKICYIKYPFDRLKNDDIMGTKTKSTNLITKRCLNPLDPKYNLQKIIKIQNFIPKFIRDSINVDDIEKAQSKWKLKRSIKTRNVNNLENMPFSKPQKEYFRKRIYCTLKVKDMNKPIKFISKRKTNPLNPTYNWDKKNFGKIIKKKKIFKLKLKNSDLNLNINDIEGAKVGTTNDKWFKKKKNRNFSKPLIKNQKKKKKI